MSIDSIAAILITVFAFILLVVEAIAEVGVISLSRSRAQRLLSRHPENLNAQRLSRITHNRERALGSFALGRTTAVVTGLTAAMFLVIGEFGFGWLTVVLTGLIGFFIIALIQAVPRRLASRSPEAFALSFASTMDALQSVFLVPATLLESPATMFNRLRIAQEEHTPEPTDLEVILEQEDSGGIEAEERKMIQGVIEIGDTAIREAMVPRPDIVAVELVSDLRSAAQIAVDRGVSRVPVYEGTIDNIVGVLYAKDVLAELLSGREGILADLMRPPLLVPESKLIDELLAEFRTLRVHVAIVLDEYGGTAGLVTIEDLIEEIVGEIEDEHDSNIRAGLVRISDREVILDGRTSIDELEEFFDCRLKAEDFDTVAGLVFDRLGKIPTVGDGMEIEDLHFSVLRMDGRRIVRIKAWIDDSMRPVKNKTNESRME